MTSSLIVLDSVFVLLGIFLLVHFWAYGGRRRQLPPGPRGLPLIGNLLDMPSEQEWLTFARWGELYGWYFDFVQTINLTGYQGDISSISMLGQTIVILNSVKIANELLDKKSSIYSDRPVLQMGGELVGWKNSLVLIPYGDRHKRSRKLFHTLVGTPNIVKQYRPVQAREVRRFLKWIMESPEKLQQHIRK
jgi:cytochrome P450